MSSEQIIRVSRVAACVRVGVSEAERAHPQILRISVALTLADPPNFADHDRLADTLDYDLIIRFLQHTLPAEGPTRLIETLADRVARHCLALSPRVSRAEVAIEKPSVLGDDGLVSVTIARSAPQAQPLHARAVAELSA